MGMEYAKKKDIPEEVGILSWEDAKGTIKIDTKKSSTSDKAKSMFRIHRLSC